MSKISSSSTLPSSFNPYAVHPFTAGAPPSARSGSIPSSHTTSPQRAAPRPATTSIPSQVIIQSHATNTYPTAHRNETHSRYKHTTQQPAQPIFTPFKPERSSSPDLNDVLSKKKSPSAWQAATSPPRQSPAARK